MAKVAARVPELDVLRGLAVAGMILVVSPGDWAATYPQLQHAAWNGWTLADMVFPTFLFGIGIALGLSFPRPWREAADRRSFRRRVGRRVALLLVTGLLLEATFNWAAAYTGGPVGKPGLDHLRLPGILQRIALCYLLAATAIIASGSQDADGRRQVRPTAVATLIAVLLVGYWALLMLVPVPGFGAGRLDPEGNLAAYLDRAIFTPPHLWPLGWAQWGGPVVYDPEGLLSTLPATANVLIGVLAARAWSLRPGRAAMVIGAAGLLMLLTGLAWGSVFVVNKRLWTSSFVLVSSGVSAVALAALAIALRSRMVAWLLTPLRVLGGNAILAFVVSTLAGRIYDLPLLGWRGAMSSPRSSLNRVALATVGDPRLASTLCAVLFVAMVTLVLWPLHRRAFHFRL